MRIDKKPNWKSVLIGIWVLACIAVLLVFGEGNPSKKESNEHLNVMVEDMRTMLANGGQVYSRLANAKYGGALLYVNLATIGWSSDLIDKYRITLLNRGWKQQSTEKERLFLCKDGMLARIDLVPEIDSSRGQSVEVYGISMKYGGDTIKLCEGKS
ncbi:hypothetical protein FAZ95_00200 [Trinickia violacea]|uniref:Uncharacterized protein n=1 Tax=Trinickia violacea TaxID=2571746 RepID=A0A4P8IJC7_9BURK|nr:hypothetical protein [Trinickia violacea]QCP47737.1 hypothetical protein FAZ95_00200 [Trinickia violacea]